MPAFKNTHLLSVVCRYNIDPKNTLYRLYSLSKKTLTSNLWIRLQVLSAIWDLKPQHSPEYKGDGIYCNYYVICAVLLLKYLGNNIYLKNIPCIQ